MTRPNGLLILIDALRHDLVADPAIRRLVTPNIDRLTAGGSFAKVVAQASNTQFVMPAFLSGTAPMDHGGYNDGCKRRPACFAETIREAGYRTALFTNCVLYNRDLGFDRGFDEVCAPINSRRALMQDIEYRLLEPVRRWRRGEMRDSGIVEFLQREYAEVLDSLVRFDHEDRAAGAISRARRINRRLARNARRERGLLETDPLPVAEKLATVPEAYYYAVLGNRRPGVRLLSVRIANKVYMLLGRLIRRLGALRHLRFGHFDTLEPMAEELAPGIAAFLDRRSQPWFAMLHVMDVHTHSICLDQIIRSPLKLARRLSRLPRIRRLCRQFGHGGHLLYFLNLSIVDDLVGEILGRIEATGQWDNTLVMVTSDHGRTLEGRDPRSTSDLRRRFFRGDLETPLIVAGAGGDVAFRPGLRDSRDVGATLLEGLGLPIPDGFEGRSALSAPGRDIVISENAGRNYCDLERDNLNFAVTGAKDKMFAVLRGSDLLVTNYYDLDADPGELENLAGRPEAQQRIAVLLEALWRERGALLEAREALPPGTLEGTVAAAN